MLTQHRFLAAMFVLLTLAACSASAQIDLSPYMQSFSPNDRISIVRPGLIVSVSDNKEGFRSVVRLWDNGQKRFETELPDAKRTNYAPFALSESLYGAYGILDAGDTLTFRFYRFNQDALEPLFSFDTTRFYNHFETPEAFILYKVNGEVELYSWEGELLRTLSVPDSFYLISIRLQEDGSVLAFGLSGDSPWTYCVLRFDSQGFLQINDYPQSFGFGDMEMPVTALSSTGEVLVSCRPQCVNPKTSLLTRIDAQGNLLWQKTLAVPGAIASRSVAELHDDGSTTLYGRAVAHSQKLYTVFRLEIDAQGRITARDIRDCATRSTFYYGLTTDVCQQVYFHTDDQVSLVIPFEDLPAHNDPGLVLE